MRDWQGYVRQRLGALRLDPAEREEITRELAGHLEEYYEELRRQGLGEEEAFERTCARAGSWKQLRRAVLLAKQEGTMTDRVKQMWIPSLLTLVVGWVVLGVVIWSGTPPLMWESWHVARRGVILYPPLVILYWPWLVSLPFIGAAGAYVSRRARAAGWQIYLSGAFPVLAIGAVFAVTFPFAFVVDAQVVPFFKASSMLANVVSWMVLPGMALVLGIVVQGIRRGPGAISHQG
jgi:hypothetical protein